jgi:acyl-CoA synthetase (AMP-forming)/AMP-acid ligase II
MRYGQLKEHVNAFAAGLQSLDLRSDDLVRLPPTPSCPNPEIAPIVLVQLPNCLAFPTAILGTLAAGLTATLVSPALTAKEIGWILQNARPRVIITASSTVGAMREAIDAQEDKKFFQSVPIYQVDVVNNQYPERTEPSSSADWTQLLKRSNKPIQKPTSFNAATRTAVILWSSGTSGKSKGVLLSHSGLVFGTLSNWNSADFYQHQQQRWLGFAPFYHVFGLMNICLPAICTGSTVYTMSGFKLDLMLEAIPRRQITYLHMAPPIGVMLAKSPLVDRYAKRDSQGKNAFSSLSGATTGGAPLGHDVIVHVYERVGFRIKMGYGLTETAGTTLQYGLTAEDMHRYGGDSGQALWGVEMMIAAEEQPSAEKATPAPVGTAGEILIRSPANMLGYLPFGGLVPGAKPDMSITHEAVTKDGWFRTGDVGNIDADGCLRITDRIKELIKVRAYQVAPAELEALLCSSGDVADAGVVATYDKSEATEWPRAFVVPANGGMAGKSEKDLHELAQKVKKLVEEHTAKYKWLKGGIVFVDAIPKSPSGKILRRVMKDGGVKGFEVKLYEPRRRDSKL